jgi:hypothetical protein
MGARHRTNKKTMETIYRVYRLPPGLLSQTTIKRKGGEAVWGIQLTTRPHK